MRIKCDIEMKVDSINKDYRRIFMSLIKNAINNYDPLLCNLLYGDENVKRKVNKPFTFSVYFPLLQKIEGEEIYFNNKVNLFFSTNEDRILVAFYNGLKRLTKIPLDGDNFIDMKLIYCFLLPKINIKSNQATFKTMSPILVNTQKSINNKFYLYPDDIEFYDEFKRIILNQNSIFGIPFNTEQIKIDIKNYKTLPLKHFGQMMSAWLGEFEMEAPQEVLQLIYDTGIGVRRSQGFGMLEFIKSNNYD